jgi:sterol-4alpha-carboxylate 3-dehydrogenase (decarboxylating)
MIAATPPTIESVLLIGGSGFLGLHLIDAFWKVEPRPEIHVFDIRALPEISTTFYSFDPAAIRVHIGDIGSSEDVSSAIKESRATVVVHSASPIHGLGQGVYYKVNVEGTRNVIECTKRAGVGALVYTSSAGVIFNGEDIYAADETTPFPKTAMDAYNETKQEGEVMILRAKNDCYSPSGNIWPRG